MIWLYLLLLLVLTLLGGSIPFLFKQFKSSWFTLLLAFSGSFLFGITLLHLMPETFQELGEKAGIYILLGFFLQLILQRLSHGVEHGHVHDHDGHVHSITPIFLGLCIHAFMEGIPLGFNYQNATTMPSIFLGVAAHKIPEAITLSALLMVSTTSKNKWLLLFLFALASPISGILAMYYGQKFYFISNLLVYIIPVVIGAFLHISTTILYESGTKSHELSRQKVIAVLLGLGFALSTLLLHMHH
jgi:zinc transporter ZupT